MRKQLLLASVAVGAVLAVVVVMLILRWSDRQGEEHDRGGADLQDTREKNGSLSRDSFQQQRRREKTARVTRAGDVRNVLETVRHVWRSAPKEADAFTAGLLRVINEHLSTGIRLDLGSSHRDKATTAQAGWPGSILSLVNACRSVISDSRERDAPEVKLTEHVLTHLANHCPSATGRVWACRALSQLAMPDSESKRSITLSHSSVVQTLDHSLALVLAESGKGGTDTKNALLLARSHSLFQILVSLKGASDPDKAEGIMAKEAASLGERLSRTAAGAANDEIREILKAIQSDMTSFIKGAKKQVAMLRTQARAESCVKGFLQAANNEDTATAIRYLTPKTAKELAESTSIRSAISGIPGTKKIHVVSIGPVHTVGNSLEVDLRIELTNAQGAVIDKSFSLHLVELNNELRIGDK